MKQISSALIAVVCTSTVSAANPTSLACSGTIHSKHYDETETVNYVAVLNLDNKSVEFRSVETIYKWNDQSGKLGPPELESKVYAYSIQDSTGDFLQIRKLGSVNDGHVILKKGLVNKYYEVKIWEDDVAQGYVNRMSGDVSVETRYYKDERSDHEYGWAMKLTCKRANQQF